MIKQFVEAWDKGKDNLLYKLKEQCASGADLEFTYEHLVRLGWSLVGGEISDTHINLTKVRCIDDGGYCGTLIFIAPFDTIDPMGDEYVCVTIDYGSCSCCDTLLSVQANDNPEERAKDYHELIMHIMQRTKILDKENEEND